MRSNHRYSILKSYLNFLIGEGINNSQLVRSIFNLFFYFPFRQHYLKKEKFTHLSNLFQFYRFDYVI